MSTEAQRVRWRNKAKRNHAEKKRMQEKQWTYADVCQLVGDWLGGNESDRYLDYTVLWKWLAIRATKEGKKLEEMMVTSGGIKLTLEYLRRVHDDEMGDYTALGLRTTCLVKMDDFLLWSESEIAEFVFRCEELVEQDRMKRQSHLVRKKMIENIKAGDKKTMGMWMEMKGLDKACEPEKEGFTLKVVDKYDVKSEEAVPGEVRIVKIKTGLPNEPLDSGQQEASANLQ